ncbi:MAG: hypothetical protein JNM90_25440 [Burkholderiales bacterium]|nr:hypothetical protein [Burkholderiales bacterium]
MRIEALSLALRPRTPWEAIDLGVALARRTGAALFLCFALPYAGFALAVNLLLWGQPAVAALVVWWSKPAFDRLALHVLAQAVFDPGLGWRRAFASLRQVPRTGLVAALTVGRFDFARSFHLPVAQLEGQRGAAARQRRALLDRRARGAAVWLGVVIAHFVVVLVLGADGLLRLLSPQGGGLSLRLTDLFDASGALTPLYLFNAAVILADCVLEPLYVAAGFTLYLSRRTDLEGWDLEIAFRRMAARRAAAALGIAAALVLAGVLPEPAQAAASPAASAERKAIDAILASPEFREREAGREWRRKGEPDARDPPAPGAPVDLSFLQKLARVLAELARIFAWFAAIAIAGWLLYHAWRRFGWPARTPRAAPAAPPDVLFGLDVRADALPADLAAAARARLAAGEPRAALSLLYRGALAGLLRDGHLAVRAGDTEGDCIRQVAASAGAPLTTYFARLVAAWGRLAYAGAPPPATEAHALIDDWERHFAPPPRGAAR